jgi:hypothetical protein
VSSMLQSTLTHKSDNGSDDTSPQCEHLFPSFHLEPQSGFVQQ